MFATHGRATDAVDQLRQLAQSVERRWGLVRELIEVIEQLPEGVHADAQKLWLLLSFQQRESAPTLESVEDAMAVLSSRLVGALRAVNGGGEYALAMSRETALARICALVDLLRPTADETTQELQPTSSAASDAGRRTSAASASAASDVGPSASAVAFAAAQAAVIERLQRAGFGRPTAVSSRHVVLQMKGRKYGFAFRSSKRYPGPGWWWTFTEKADHAKLAECDQVVLVGLMASPDHPSGVREEVLVAPWEEAVAIAQRGRGQTGAKSGRLHVYVGDGAAWDGLVRPIRDLGPEAIRPPA